MVSRSTIGESKDSEKLVERKLVELIKQNGGLCIKLLTNQFTGLPDRMCLLPQGKLIFVELKTTGAKPRKVQLCVHNMLRKIGFRVEVIDSVSGVKALIEELIKK